MNHGLLGERCKNHGSHSCSFDLEPLACHVATTLHFVQSGFHFGVLEFSRQIKTRRPIIPMAPWQHNSTCCNATLVAHAHFQHLEKLLEGEATMEILQTCTLPKTDIAPKNGGFQSEYPISFSRALFSGAMSDSGRANGTPRKHIPQRTKGWESLMELSNHHFWVSSSLVSGVY